MTGEFAFLAASRAALHVDELEENVFSI